MAKEPLGFIYYRSTDETIEYYDAKKMLKAVRHTVYCEGPTAVAFKVYKKNIDLIYELNAILHGEYGLDLQKKPFIINYVTPEFKIYDKLRVVYEYEQITNKKGRITQSYLDEVLLKDSVVNMSAKAIKSLVNRRYETALKFNQKTETPKIKRKKDDPER